MLHPRRPEPSSSGTPINRIETISFSLVCRSHPTCAPAASLQKDKNLANSTSVLTVCMVGFDKMLSGARRQTGEAEISDGAGTNEHALPAAHQYSFS
jgi:hypothetical protein